VSTPRYAVIKLPERRQDDPMRTFGERRGEPGSRVGITKPAPAKRTKRSRR
jgi:hypothetical protein